MYILKNAWLNIIRNKGRNILIGIVILIISITSTIALAINNTSDKLIVSYNEKQDIKATIGINREKSRENMNFDKDMSEEEREKNKNDMFNIYSNASSLSVSDVEKYAESKYVTNYYYQVSLGVKSSLEKVSMDDDFSANMKKEKFNNTNNSDFTIIGYSNLDSMEEFINGKYKIIEGEILINSDSCVINSELASMNDAKVGDKIQIIDPNNEKNVITLTISGIYEETSETNDEMNMFTNSVNNILTNVKSLDEFINNSDIAKSVNPTFILDDKNNIDNFEEDLRELGLNEYLTINTNLDEIEASTKTISNVKTFACIFLILTLIIGGVILFVINMINIRERKYEIGVLRTIGMKKSSLTLQFITELSIVALISLIIGATIGSVSSIGVSNYLLENEINNSQQEINNINANFGGERKFDRVNGIVNINKVESIDATVDIKVLIELLFIGIILTLLSSISSMISINKFSPLTILKERS